jgi:DNA-binding response OmpR family regulator
MTDVQELTERRPVDPEHSVHGPTAAPPNVYDARILIVDDDPDAARTTARLLERGGLWRIDTAAGGRRGLAAMQRQTPDVLLLDVHMPELDGFATLRAMSTGGVRQSVTSVLAISGDPSPDIRRSILLQGANDFVTRPCPGRELVERVYMLACRTRSVNRALRYMSLLDGLVRVRVPPDGDPRRR